MLNQRQIEILLELCNHTEEYLTASYFADKLNVSLRTVQGDMKAIKTELEEESAHILSRKHQKEAVSWWKMQMNFPLLSIHCIRNIQRFH